MLAAQAGISEVYLRVLFKKQYGTTPRQCVTQLRIRRAMQLLAGSRQSVSGIAAACGFSGAYYFFDCFKTHTGMPPT